MDDRRDDRDQDDRDRNERDRNEGDRDVEALLRRYRPVAPPASLRARIAATSEAPEAAAPPGDRRAEPMQPDRAAAQPVEVPLQPATVPAQATGHAWPWLAAAAALLLCVLGLRIGGDGLIAQTQAQLADGGAAATDRDRADAAVASVAETLGGDDIAWRAAAVLVRQQQQQKRRDEASGDRQDVGSDMP